MTQKTCMSDAIHLWNMAPEEITNIISLSQAKNEIKKLCQKTADLEILIGLTSLKRHVDSTDF